jgi:hypothetical protein
MGTISAQAVIDPVTQKHANVTVRSASQQTAIRQLELYNMYQRPFPLVYSLNQRRSAFSPVRQIHSIQQFLREQFDQSVGTRAECRLDTHSQLMQTFDGVQANVPIGYCWTVLAKDCGSQQLPQFAVLIKAIPGTEQKKLKVIAPDMGILTIEPRSDGEQGKLQISLSDNKQQTFTSEMDPNQIPDGLEFAHNGKGSFRETVVVECAEGALQVRFNGQTASIQLRGKKYQDKQCGICGHWDGNMQNEWLLPNGEIAANAEQFHRAYTISSALSTETVDDCADEAREQFYTEQGNSIQFGGNAENNGQTGGNAPKQQGKERNSYNDSSNGGAKQKWNEIEAQQHTVVMEYAHQLCFSLKPVKQCPIGSFASSTSPSTDNDSKSNNKNAMEPKKLRVPFTCLERGSLEAKRLKQRIQRNQRVELNEYPASFQEMVVVPERCIQYDQQKSR